MEGHFPFIILALRLGILDLKPGKYFLQEKWMFWGEDISPVIVHGLVSVRIDI